MKMNERYKYEYVISSERCHRRSDEENCSFYSDTKYEVGDLIEMDGIYWTINEVVDKSAA